MKLAVLYIFLYAAACCSAQSIFAKARKNSNENDILKSLAIMDSCVAKSYYSDSALYYSSLLYLKTGQAKMARKKYQALSKAYPQFRERHYLNGLLFFSTENYGKSIDEFNLAAKMDLKNVRVIYNRALAFGMLEEYLSAIEDLGACIALDPNYTLAYYSRAYWYEYTGNYAEAAKDYESVIRLDPKNYDAYLGLAYVYQIQNETIKACQVISNAIKEGSQVAEEIRDLFCK